MDKPLPPPQLLGTPTCLGPNNVSSNSAFKAHLAAFEISHSSQHSLERLLNTDLHTASYYCTMNQTHFKRGHLRVALSRETTQDK